MPYVILCRVSTDDQNMDGQHDACLAFIERNPGPIRKVLYEEDFSGSLPLNKRPILQEAIELLQKGDILLVHKRDRMFRGDPFSNGFIENEIRRRGATLRSVMGEGTEGDDPAQILLRRVTDMFSEHERNMIAYRTKTALQAKRRRGERVGTIPYGYSLSQDGTTLLPVPMQQQVIQTMRDLRARGFSLRKIGRHVEAMGAYPPKSDRWTAQSISQILQRDDLPAPPPKQPVPA